MDARNPFKAGLVALPIIYGATVFINVFSIVNDGPKCKYITSKFQVKKIFKLIFALFILVLHMDNIPLYIGIVASLGVALLVAILVQTFVVPWQKKKILGANGKAKFTFGDSDGKSNALFQNACLLIFVILFLRLI